MEVKREAGAMERGRVSWRGEKRCEFGDEDGGDGKLMTTLARANKQ